MSENEQPDFLADGPRELKRRPILTLLAVGGGAMLLEAAAEASPAGLIGDLLASLFGPGDGAAPPTSLLAVRPDDGLFVTLAFTNLDVKTSLGKPPQLALHDPAVDGLLTIGFTPQSIFEQTTFDNRPPGTDPPVAAPAQPVPALVSGPSRIVLRVPAGTEPFAYDLPTLLDLQRFWPVVNPAADGTSPPAAPTAGQTAIEAPFRLILSPPSTAAFAAVKTPVTRHGRTELWHARAVPRKDDGTPVQTPAQLPVRAIWTPDLVSSTDLPDWAKVDGNVTLLPADRQDIVKKSTTELPAQASKLMISPLGATLDLDAHWTTDGLIGWKHQAWLGRDTYVRVERAGYLFPFGFPAEAVTVTKRIISDGEAFLQTQQFVIVRRSFVDYPQDAAVQNHAGRGQPFTRAETSTLVSPPLFAPIKSGDFVTIRGDGGNPAELSYKLTLTAKDGKVVTVDLPLKFLFDFDAMTTAKVQPFVDAYNTLKPELRTLQLRGQKVAYVPPAPPADHALPTNGLLLGVEPAVRDRNVEKELAAFPVLSNAEVHVEELDAVGGPQPPVAHLSYEDTIYLKDGFGATNTGEVWAKLSAPPAAGLKADDAPGQALQFAMSQATGGGMAAPQFAVDALSRVHGTITDLKNIATNHFDPTAYFKSEAIKLLGSIPLNSVIELDPLDQLVLPTDENIPKIKTNRIGDKVETVITWNAKLKQFPEGDGNIFTFAPAKTDPNRRLRLEVRFTVRATARLLRSYAVS